MLDAVAVRRTRSFVKAYYPNDTVPIDGRDQVIAFPTPRVRKVSYDLDAVLPGFFDRIARALDPEASPGDPESLTLARCPAGAAARDHPRGRPRRLLAGPHLRSAHLRLQPTMIPPCASRPSPTFTSGGPFRTGA